MPPVRSVLDDLPFALARATVSFRRLSDQTLRAVGVDSQAPGMATVLHALDQEGQCAVNALVERTLLPNGTLTGLLDTLESERYLKRVPNPDDGRSWLVQLTPRGRTLCQKLDLRHAAVMGIFANALTERENKQLKKLLNKLTEHMRSHLVQQDDTRTLRKAKTSITRKPKSKR